MPASAALANPRPALLGGAETLLRGTPAAPGLRVQSDGRDITAAFTPLPDGSLLGLVTGHRGIGGDETLRQA